VTCHLPAGSKPRVSPLQLPLQGKAGEAAGVVVAGEEGVGVGEAVVGEVGEHQEEVEEDQGRHQVVLLVEVAAGGQGGGRRQGEGALAGRRAGVCVLSLAGIVGHKGQGSLINGLRWFEMPAGLQRTSGTCS
jgi:hypothetical protein